MVKPSVISSAEPKTTTTSSNTTWLSQIPEKPSPNSAAFKSRALNRLDDVLPQLVQQITGMPEEQAAKFNNVLVLMHSRFIYKHKDWRPQLRQALQVFCQKQFRTSLASLLKNPPAPWERLVYRGQQVLSQAPDSLPLPLVGNLGRARAVVLGVKSAITTRPRTAPKEALFASVKAKNSQGLTVVVQLEAQRSSINGRVQITAYVVKQVSTYSATPINPAQKRHPPDTEGYHVSTVGKNSLVIDAHGEKITDVEKAKNRVLETIRRGGLTTNTEEQVKASQVSRARQQKINGQLAAQIQASGPQKIGPWTSPIPLSKPVKHMRVEEKLEYSIRVAIKFAPAEVGKQLKSLLSPLSLAIMAGFAASHAVGVGQVADIVGALLLGKQAIEVGMKFIDFMKTAITAEDAMTLTDAGRKLSQVGAELFTTGLSVLGAIGLKKVAGQFKTRISPEPINRNTPVLLENNRVKTIQTQLNTKTGLYEPVVESPTQSTTRIPIARDATPQKNPLAPHGKGWAWETFAVSIIPPVSVSPGQVLSPQQLSVLVGYTSTFLLHLPFLVSGKTVWISWSDTAKAYQLQSENGSVQTDPSWESLLLAPKGNSRVEAHPQLTPVVENTATDAKHPRPLALQLQMSAAVQNQNPIITNANSDTADAKANLQKKNKEFDRMLKLLDIHVQPQYEISLVGDSIKKTIVGVEVLLNFRPDANGNRDFPDTAIKRANEVGRMQELTKNVMEATFELANKRPDLPKVAFNVPPEGLTPKFLRQYEANMKRYPEAAKRVGVEVTEEGEITPENVLILRKLHRLGVSLSFDDFGAQSPGVRQSHIERLLIGRRAYQLEYGQPGNLFDTVKLDAPFVKKDSNVYLKLTLQFLKNLGVKHVLAERNETEKETRYLFENGVRRVQGWDTGKKMSPGELPVEK